MFPVCRKKARFCSKTVRLIVSAVVNSGSSVVFSELSVLPVLASSALAGAIIWLVRVALTRVIAAILLAEEVFSETPWLYILNASLRNLYFHS